jgi:hypothetical protein
MRSSGKDLPTGGIPILMSALGHELTSQRRLSWFALCQYQTLPVFGAAQTRRVRLTKAENRTSRAVAPKGIDGGPVRSVPAPGVGTRDLSFAMAPTHSHTWGALAVVRCKRLYPARACDRREGCWFISPHRDCKPGSYMRLRLGSTVRVRPKSELKMGMLTR